jgi:surfeit locus 1 family protein
MTVFKKMFSSTWLFVTLLVLAASAVCIRLGVWQLDRLKQRRAFNAEVISMRSAQALDLNRELPADISSMEWRKVTVTGTYDFENQVALRNQYYGYDYQYGYDLITPLLFDGGAVLVDRGWIPADGNGVPRNWRQYDQTGQVAVAGQVRLGHDKPATGGVADAEFSSVLSRLDMWNNLNVERISRQTPYAILPFYIELNLDENDSDPPIPNQSVLDLTNGPHLGYAVQWFSFALIFMVAYGFYLSKQESK